MKHITFYFDVISPYAYLAFERMPQVLQGLSYQVSYKPVLFAGMLKHYGQLGPAEITPKRIWTYQQMMWLARELEIPMLAPASHPFNPISLLRLALACGTKGVCNRYIAETLFRHVWCSGLEASDAVRTQLLIDQLQPARPIEDVCIKAELQSNTDAAIAAGVFGVPSMLVDQALFWGVDALPMLRQYLEGDAWFTNSVWLNAAELPLGVARKPHHENKTKG